jgi:hypothetical protein
MSVSPAMTNKNAGLIGLCRKKKYRFSRLFTYHRVIHQQALCTKESDQFSM